MGLYPPALGNHPTGLILVSSRSNVPAVGFLPFSAPPSLFFASQLPTSYFYFNVSEISLIFLENGTDLLEFFPLSSLQIYFVPRVFLLLFEGLYSLKDTPFPALLLLLRLWNYERPSLGDQMPPGEMATLPSFIQPGTHLVSIRGD